MIEGWEIERHEAVLQRGGYEEEDWFRTDGDAPRSMVDPVEFPYDVGVYANLAQAMGTSNPLYWLLPFASGPRVARLPPSTTLEDLVAALGGAKGGSAALGTGWTYEENGLKTASHMVVPHDADTTDVNKKIDLTTALQYGQASGYPPLSSYIRQFTRECLHPNVPYSGGPEVALTVGSTDGFSKVLDVFTNVWVEGKNDVRERPGLLVDVFMYPLILNQALPRGIQICPVEMDEGGMAPYSPGGLEDILANWDDAKGKRPHLLYTVSMGHNPTSGVLSVQRRRELYEICSKYDVIIAEDDPYWYLQFPSAELEEAKARNKPIPELKVSNTLPKKSGYPFLDSLVPSFLNIDVDGRVVRLDTFSKTVAPGSNPGPSSHRVSFKL
ncbi:hypothetical protein NUW58_g10632 [Xylaria curta]|uniref:Uncharacterized protein n=1 Tax=Xylaria curta TaxID=42375 RepID=A0ACC1MJX7_9PEZI|nr:hypothetical protein NUW58_g10632 [Xylaria curta]